ncbi:MAG: hypothetical protein ACJ8AW_10075 [Rhodopila sp.]
MPEARITSVSAPEQTQYFQMFARFGLGNERHCRPLAQGDRHQQQGKPLIWPALFWDGHSERGGRFIGPRGGNFVIDLPEGKLVQPPTLRMGPYQPPI